MTLLTETARLLRERLGDEFDTLTIERLVIGLFFTGVKLSNGAGGICYTPIKDIPEAVCCPSSAGRVFNPEQIRGMPAAQMLEYLESPEPLKTCTSIAVLNALSDTCLSTGGFSGYDLEKGDVIDFVNLPQQASVAVVGAIIPVLHALKQRGGTWWIVEQDPRVLHPDEMPHYIPAADSASVLGKADTVIVTGVTIINHTLEGLLAATRPGGEIAIMGPSASMLPDAFFNQGVRAMGGVRVNDADNLLDILAVGGSGYHFFGKAADQFTMVAQNAE